jgi:hypothetical protein
MEKQFRPLSGRERELIERLLNQDFPGRDELRIQLQSATARQVLDDGTLELRCESGLKAPVRDRVPTEGTCRDIDGGTVDVLLHVVDGVMKELEILKHGGPLLRPPEAKDLTV